MRILHTADWHLGRSLHGVDLADAQADFLDFLVATARDRAVDAVLVAGDVYDRAIPSVPAVDMLARALRALSAVAPVVMISGNHDSAVRLGFGADLFRDGVHVCTDVRQVGVPVAVPCPDGDLLIYPIPYLEPDVVRYVLAQTPADADGLATPASSGASSVRAGSVRVEEPLARTHAAVLAAACDRARADLDARRHAAHAQGLPEPRSAVMAHAFVIGGAASDSERDIRVGGVDVVPASTFRGFDYVALGHLHGPQAISSDDGQVIRYAGSPLAYSFSEVNHRKSVAVIDWSAGGVETELVPAPVPRPLAEIVGPLDDVLGPAHAAHGEDWVRVIVTDPVRPDDLFARVRARFPHALVILHRPEGEIAEMRARRVEPQHDPVAIAREFVAAVGGSPPTVQEQAVLQEAFEQAVERSA